MLAQLPLIVPPFLTNAKAPITPELLIVPMAFKVSAALIRKVADTLLSVSVPLTTTGPLMVELWSKRTIAPEAIVRVLLLTRLELRGSPPNRSSESYRH